MSLQPKPRLTPEDYLALERSADAVGKFFLIGLLKESLVGFLNLVHRPDQTGPLVQVQQKLMHGRRPVAPAFLESIEFTQQMRTTQHMAGLGEFEIG